MKKKTPIDYVAKTSKTTKLVVKMTSYNMKRVAAGKKIENQRLLSIIQLGNMSLIHNPNLI